jgi:hypothetical protein
MVADQEFCRRIVYVIVKTQSFANASDPFTNHFPALAEKPTKTLCDRKTPRRRQKVKAHRKSLSGI